MEITEENLVDLLSTAMGDTCGFDWWRANDEDYIQAREELLAENNNNNNDNDDDEDGETVYYEGVLARILFNGGKLSLLEPETDWEWGTHKTIELRKGVEMQRTRYEPVGGVWHEIGLEEVLQGLRLYFSNPSSKNHPRDINALLCDGDFFDADAVFQYAAYGEIVFG